MSYKVQEPQTETITVESLVDQYDLLDGKIRELTLNRDTVVRDLKDALIRTRSFHALNINWRALRRSFRLRKEI